MSRKKWQTPLAEGRRVMPDPEFDLDDMELAEIIIEDSKIEDLKK